MQLVASGQQRAQTQWWKRLRAAEDFGEWSRQETDRNFTRCQPFKKLGWLIQNFLVRQINTASTQQVRPRLPYRSIKGRRCHLSCAVCGRQLVGLLVPRGKVYQAAVRNGDAFGLAG